MPLPWRKRLNPAMMDADEMNVGIVRNRTLRASLAALALVGAALAAPGPATAADLETLRDRAQFVADQVTAREHDLQRLTQRHSKLSDEIESASRDIGILELELHRAEAAHQRAMDDYVARAVEAYMDGSTTHLALLLSSKDMNQLFTIAEATVASAQEDATALNDALDAADDARTRQEQIDERKQRLLVAEAKVQAVQESIENALAARRELLADLTADIKELERQARLAAAEAARPDEAFLDLLAGSGPSLGIPEGYAGTGVTFEGIASWYGPGFEGNTTASGDIFDSSLFTAASKDLPLGSWLFVQHKGRGVVVLVNDRGPYVGDRILDLSKAAAQALGIGGLGWIQAEVIVKR